MRHLTPVPAGRPARISRAQIVDRLDAFLGTHADEAISIAQLCDATGVRERSLRNAVRAVRGMSPKRYLTRRRMEAVRIVLEAAGSTPTTVTRVATDHGFFELGRFAATYNALFGERPSQTLRGSRQTVSAA